MKNDQISTMDKGGENGDPFDKSLAAHSDAVASVAPEKRGRGRPPGSKAQRAEVQPRPPATQQFQPENVRMLVRLPFDLGAAYSGSEAWLLEEAEEVALSVPGAMALNEWFPAASPKWSALAAFSLALLGIVSRKYLIYVGEKKIQVEEGPKNESAN